LRSLWVGRSQDQPITQRVQDAGGSEGDAVMASIRVQNLPDVKTNRLPAGVLSRENRINNFHMGKQMMAGITCWCAHKRKRWVAPGRYCEVSAGMGWRVSPSRSAFEMLERYAMKVARTVLRGGRGSNASPLPDHPNPGNPGTEQPGQACAGAAVVGVCAFSSRLRGLKWVPSKRRCRVSPTCH
jgi:hypothetical protein